MHLLMTMPRDTVMFLQRREIRAMVACKQYSFFKSPEIRNANISGGEQGIQHFSPKDAYNVFWGETLNLIRTFVSLQKCATGFL